MCRHCKKGSAKWIIAVIAAIAAIAGIAVFVAAYLKKHAAFLSDSYDYDDELFYEDDNQFCDCDELSDNKACDVPSESKQQPADIIDSAFDDEDDTTI